MAEVELYKSKENVTMLILEGLIEEDILGNHFLVNHHAKIDYKKRKVTLTFGEIRKQVTFWRTEKPDGTKIKAIITEVYNEHGNNEKET